MDEIKPINAVEFLGSLQDIDSKSTEFVKFYGEKDTWCLKKLAAMVCVINTIHFFFPKCFIDLF